MKGNILVSSLTLTKLLLEFHCQIWYWICFGWTVLVMITMYKELKLKKIILWNTFINWNRQLFSLKYTVINFITSFEMKDCWILVQIFLDMLYPFFKIHQLVSYARLFIYHFCCHGFNCWSEFFWFHSFSDFYQLLCLLYETRWKPIHSPAEETSF